MEFHNDGHGWYGLDTDTDEVTHTYPTKEEAVAEAAENIAESARREVGQ